MKNYLLHLLILTGALLLAFQGSFWLMKAPNRWWPVFETASGAVMIVAALIGLTRELIEERRSGSGKIKRGWLTLLGFVLVGAIFPIVAVSQAPPELGITWLTAGVICFLFLFAADYGTG